MQEFESFIYLDVPRTGSTFIKGILRKYCASPQIQRRTHTGLSKEYDRSKFCFISVRDPLDQYLSLYSFGCGSQGGLYGLLQSEGAGDVYNGSWTGFLKWLRFVLRPGNAAHLDRDYAECGNGRISKLVGLASFRVLRVAIPDAHEVLRRCRDRDEIRAEYRRRKAYHFTIRYENFRGDLAELLNAGLKPYVKDLDKALKHIETRNAANASNRPIKMEGERALGPGLRRILREREWLLCEEFGYELNIPDIE